MKNPVKDYNPQEERPGVYTMSSGRYLKGGSFKLYRTGHPTQPEYIEVAFRRLRRPTESAAGKGIGFRVTRTVRTKK